MYYYLIVLEATCSRSDGCERASVLCLSPSFSCSLEIFGIPLACRSITSISTLALHAFLLGSVSVSRFPLISPLREIAKDVEDRML